MGEMDIGLDIEPVKGAAHSGDLEVDLPSLFVTVAEAAEERDTAVAILIDEIQYFSATELSALIMAMLKMQQRQLPLLLVGAGLPILPGLAGESKSYAELNTLGPVRSSLIKQGMVYSPSHGEMAFTVPLFGEFMRRAKPQFGV